MKYINYEKTLVIVANDVNISIFKPWWLIKNNIIREEEIAGDVIVSPVAISVPTAEFVLGIFPNRIQMAFPLHGTNMQENIIRVAAQIIKKLPHTPYTGIGLNFNYFVSPEQKDIFEWSKIHFATDFANKVSLGPETKPKYGSYFSFDTLGGRLKLDIKPVVADEAISSLVAEWSRGKDMMRANFNFHYEIDIRKDSIDKIVDVLSMWTGAQKASEKIISQLTD
jgi:hypothetical protein